MSPSRVSRLETGKITPRPKDIALLSRALGVPPSFFARQTMDLGPVAFRKQARLTGRERDRILARTQDYIERRDEVTQLLTLPQTTPEPYPYSVATYDEVEKAAVWVRERWQLGRNPIHSVVDELEQRNISVLRISVDERFDGLSSLPTNPLDFIVFNGRRSVDRQRFTLLHELGHLLLNTTVDDKLSERFMDRFAGALAVPRETLIDRLGAHRSRLHPTELIGLKEDFGLSIAALLYRAKDCGIITEYTHRQGMITIGRLGWRTEEPAGFKGKEQPRRLRELIARALAEGLIDQAKADELYGEPFVPAGLFPPGPEAIRRAEQAWRRTERTMLLEDQSVEYTAEERGQRIKSLARDIQARMNEQRRINAD